MSDLVVAIRAAIDEDERIARDALHADAVDPGVWMTEHHNSETHNEPNRCHIAEDRGGHYWSVAHEVFIPNAEHMARHDPARVLHQVAAHREILELHDNVVRSTPAGTKFIWCPQCGGDVNDPDRPCPTLRALAKGYGIEAGT